MTMLVRAVISNEGQLPGNVRNESHGGFDSHDRPRFFHKENQKEKLPWKKF